MLLEGKAINYEYFPISNHLIRFHVSLGTAEGYQQISVEPSSRARTPERRKSVNLSIFKADSS